MNTTRRHSRLTTRTLGIALIALGLSGVHAALAQQGSGGGNSRVATFRETAGGSGNSRVATFGKTKGSSGKGTISTVSGERGKYGNNTSRVIATNQSRGKPVKGGVKGKGTRRDAPIIRVYRTAAGEATEGLMPGLPIFLSAEASQGAPIRVAMFDSTEIALVAFDRPIVADEVVSLVDEIDQVAASGAHTDAPSPVSLMKAQLDQPEYGAPIPAEHREQQPVAKPVTPMIMGGALVAPKGR